jgi:hypothetical protein
VLTILNFAKANLKSDCISSKYQNIIWFVAQCSNIDEFSYQKKLFNDRKVSRKEMLTLFFKISNIFYSM